MASWSRNNRAATTTWTTMKVLGQIPQNTVFKDAGAFRVDELTFWGQFPTEDMRTVQIGSLCTQIDNFFRDVRGASYEEGVTPEQALTNLRDALSNPDNTLADLAGINDASYLFWEEK